MATDLGQKKPSAKKIEAFVEDRIEGVRQQLRQRDLNLALLRLGCVVVGYALAMAGFDLLTQGLTASWVEWTRYAGFGLFLVGLLTTGIHVIVCLNRRINPYFVARQLEQTIPDAKNAVINWLDLKDEEMPTAIRGSLSQRAASSLKKTDADHLAEPRRTWAWGIGFATIMLGLVVLILLRPSQFGSLMQRAFAPFKGFTLDSRVRIHMKRPAEGNVVISDRQGIDFAAEMDGPVPEINRPGAPMLHYRYQPDEPFVSQPLFLENTGFWTTRLSRDQVQTGFTYKITAADASTPEYQVKVRPTLLATKFEVAYHPRPYRKADVRKVAFPNEKYALPRFGDYRGTRMEIAIQTNAAVRSGQMVLESKTGEKSIPLSVSPENANLLLGNVILEESAQVRFQFESTQGDSNADRRSYDLQVFEDNAPALEITKPGQDITLPANGTLYLEGSARDDFGLKKLGIYFQVDKTNLHPRMIPISERVLETDVSEVIALDELKFGVGQPVLLKKGQILEYWLEAEDACDFPRQQVGKSKVYKVAIVDPYKDKKQQQQDRKNAQDQKENKKEHDKKKDQEQKNNQAGNPSNDNQKNEKDDKINDVLNQAEKQKEQQENRGNAKPESNKGDSKSNEAKPGEGPQDNAQKKDQKSEQGPSPSQAKDQGSEKGDSGQAKDQGKKEEKGSGNDGGQKKEEKVGKGKDDPMGSGKDNSSKAKPSEDGSKPPPAESKDGGQGSPQASKDKGDGSPDSTKGESKQGPPEATPQGKNQPGKAKGSPPQEKANSKTEPGQGEKMEAKQPQQKDGSGDKQAKGEGKQADKTKVSNRAKDDLKSPGREPTADEIEQLKSIAKEKSPDGESAAKGLVDVAQQSKDAAQKKGIEEFLKQIGKPELAEEVNKQPGMVQDPSGKNKSPETKTEQKGKKEDGGTTGNPTPTKDDLQPADKADSRFGRKGGNLQLEDLKKLVTPEILKKAGMTEAEWRQFLTEAEKNRQLLPEIQKSRQENDTLKGSASKLPQTGIRNVQSTRTQDSGQDRLQTGAPPELRQEYNEFTLPKRK